MIVPAPDGDPTELFASQEYTPPIVQEMFSPPQKVDSFTTMIPRKTLPAASISHLWEMVFADNSAFFADYHARRKEVNLQVAPWNMSQDRSNGFRFVSLTTPCAIPTRGIQPTLLEEAHRFCVVENKAKREVLLVYHISSQTPTVPYGKTFRTEAVWYITNSSMDADSCSVVIFGNCRKMTDGFNMVVRKMASGRAISEMTTAYKLMMQMCMTELGGGGKESPDRSSEALSTPPPGGVSEEGGVGDGSEGKVNETLQAVVLVLGVLALLILFFSGRSLMETSVQVKKLVSEPLTAVMGGERGALQGIGASTSSYYQDEKARICDGNECSLGKERGRGGQSSFGSTGFTNSYLESVHLASNSAEIQSLRYRYIEQQREINQLQQIVSSLKWWMWMQWLLVFGASIFAVWKFFFDKPQDKRKNKVRKDS